MRDLRYWLIIAMLVGSTLLVDARGNHDVIPPRSTLDRFPTAVGGWIGHDVPIDPETMEVLGNGDFLSRVYAEPGNAHFVNLFIAYFPTQRSGMTIHSPRNCLPGAGWMFDSSQYLQLKDSTGKPHNVGEYVISNGDARAFVIYWYEAHGRSTASEFKAKMYLVTDSMLSNRTDGGLIRVITFIGDRESTGKARARAEAFTSQLFTNLPQFIPD